MGVFHKQATGVFKASSEGKTAEFLIYDAIGEDLFFEGVTAKGFVTALNNVGTVDTINVRINSPGGVVYDAVAIYEALKRNPAQVNVYIDGIAASAASMIAMAGDKIYIAPTAMMMVHGARVGVFGPAGKLREIAEILDKLTGQMALAYGRSGQSPEALATMLSKDTYFTADEAIAAGFADDYSSGSSAPEATAKFDLSIFGVASEEPETEGILVENKAKVAENSNKDDKSIEKEGISADVEETAEKEAAALRAARFRSENLRLAEV